MEAMGRVVCFRAVPSSNWLLQGVLLPGTSLPHPRGSPVSLHRDYRQLDDTSLPSLRDVALLATRSHLRLWYSGLLATTCPSSSGTVNIGHAMSLPRGPWMVGHAMPLPQLRDSKLLATPRLSLTPGDSGWLATQCPPPSPHTIREHWPPRPSLILKERGPLGAAPSSRG